MHVSWALGCRVKVRDQVFVEQAGDNNKDPCI